MNIGEQGLALIRRWEKFEPHRYLCPAGWWTIGFGAIHDLHGDPVTPQTPDVTREEAERMLLWDAGIAAGAVNRLCPVPLSQPRFDALCSFTFNLGGGKLQSSTLRQKVLREEHALAQVEFGKWVKARDPRTGQMVSLKGLVARRGEEAALYGEEIGIVLAAGVSGAGAGAPAAPRARPM